jgi:hypothetical protein
MRLIAAGPRFARKISPTAAFLTLRVAPGGGAALPYFTLGGVIVTFPDGSRVQASSIADRRIDDPERSFGLYLDEQWQPSWPADLIAWRDFGLPEEPETAARQIEAAFQRARGGELVEVGCLGGCGRTGTVLACMAVLAGVPSGEAVAWVRDSYRPEAVETEEQEDWVRWFAGRAHRAD